MFKTVSGIVFIALVVSLALQAFPNTGILLMMLGAAWLTGLLVNVFLISLALEAAFGRIPRFLMAVPVMAYAGYYAGYVAQTIEINRTEAELRASNSGKVLNFDPAKYSLVTADAQMIATRYAIPVAYEPNPNFEEKYRSIRLVRPDQCKLQRDSLSRIQTFGVPVNNDYRNMLCQLSSPEAPSNQIITATRSGDSEVWKRKYDISLALTEISVGGQVIGSFKTADVQRLPAFPLAFIGCGLGGGPSGWQCFAAFIRSNIRLDTAPASADRATLGSPESVMLGLHRLTASDFSNFRGYPENEVALSHVAGEPQRVEDHVFALLKELIDGGYPKVRPGFGPALAQNAARLAPFAEAMANRFIELGNIRPSNADGQDYDYRYEGLAAALLKLPDEAFAKVAAPLFAYFVEGMIFNQFPDLRARISRFSGPQPLEFYEADFLAASGYRRLFPVLAICRIGRASPNVIAEMKAQALRDLDSPAPDDDSKSALLVTLLKLGEDGFIRDNKAHLLSGSKDNFESWLAAVLSGMGATETGPNNCMTKDWNGRRVTKPSLQWANGRWFVRS